MVEPKPLRPRVRRNNDRGRYIERVALDVVDLRVLETELSKIGQVTVTSEQFEGEASSIEEFTRHGLTSVEELTMSARPEGGYSRVISVGLTRERAFIWLANNTEHALAGAQLRAEQICRARVRRLGLWASRLIGPFFAGIFISLGLLAAFASEERDGKSVVATGWMAIPLAFLLLGLASATLSHYAKGQILLVPREEAPGWFTRNRDDLSVQVVVGALLLGLGLAIGRLT